MKKDLAQKRYGQRYAGFQSVEFFSDPDRHNLSVSNTLDTKVQVVPAG
jgi:hypothetical protein